jgi:hypothetical protein
MRTTVRIEDDLLRQLKERAHRENVSISSFLNRLIRDGLARPRSAKPPRPYRQKVHNMGPPKINLDKALSFAAQLEDEEIIKKLLAGK